MYSIYIYKHHDSAITWRCKQIDNLTKWLWWPLFGKAKQMIFKLIKHSLVGIC